MKKLLSFVSALVVGSVLADITVDTKTFTLTIGDDAAAKSLVVKATGEECLDARDRVPLFSSTQIRPFNNEIKLMHPNKRTTYPANRVRREGDRLIVGFRLAPYEAVVKVTEADGYALFELVDFISNNKDEKQYGGLYMDVPPVAEFRVLQLPVKERANFGEWLNVCWDDRAAVAVVAAEPYADIDHEERTGYQILRADLARGRNLRGGKAAIVAGVGEKGFLASMDGFEKDLGLPRGVESRKNPLLNASIYWTSNIRPDTVDRHIAYAKQGGFKLMLLYYTAFCDCRGYSEQGKYKFWPDRYPNGEKDLQLVIDKIRAAGITPGFHTLQTHIGTNTPYMTPSIDPRLNLTRRFTLLSDIPADGKVDELVVAENPVDSPRCGPRVQMLNFCGEGFCYTSYTTTPPYKFLGVTRGAFATTARAHRRGEIGGILDMSEYGGTSCYINQDTDLQDEIAEKIARLCDMGMDFCYFDGSEGANPPCGINVPLSQYRVVRKLKKAPLFVEGAAKGHFGWHFQSGANAFDYFAPDVFKQKIVEYPLAEAPLMRKDFTRLDFGWWKPTLKGPKGWRGKDPTIGSQADMWEFGTSKAAAWDCPATIQCSLEFFDKCPRTADLLEVMRRWEDVRAKKWLTDEQRAALRDPKREFHLLLNGKGDYELVPYEQVPVAGSLTSDVRAFVFERNGETYATWWHTDASAKFALMADVTLLEKIDGAPVACAKDGGKTVLPADDRRYLKTKLSAAALAAAFDKAEILK